MKHPVEDNEIHFADSIFVYTYQLAGLISIGAPEKRAIPLIVSMADLLARRFTFQFRWAWQMDTTPRRIPGSILAVRTVSPLSLL